MSLVDARTGDVVRQVATGPIPVAVAVDERCGRAVVTNAGGTAAGSRVCWGGALRWSLHILWRGYQQALRQSPAVHPARASAHGTWAEMDAWRHQMDARSTATMGA